MKKLLLLLPLFAGCTLPRTNTYHITSTPPQARIEVDGITKGEAPLDISLYCGPIQGGIYWVSAFPKDGGTVQKKLIDACVWAANALNIHFDTSFEPTQNINLKIKQ